MPPAAGPWLPQPFGRPTRRSTVQQASAEVYRAMALWSKAVAAGWSNVISIEKDSDLDGIKDRADYKELVGKLKASKNVDKAR